MHYDQQVVTAPLWIARHKLCHNLIDLLDNVHPEQFLEFYLTRRHNGPDDLQRSCIELGMTDLEVLEEDLDQA